jgi:hypothetical protein
MYVLVGSIVLLTILQIGLGMRRVSAA